MIDHQEYQARRNRCLDERRDPLDDAELVAFLEAHPEHLEDFANERSDLREVAARKDTQPKAKRRLPIVAVAATAAGVLIGLGIWQVLRGTTPGQVAESKHQADAHTAGSHAPSRILSASLQEVEPRLRAAANFTVHERLVQTTTITLEAYEQRSELR